eukprot:113381-Hanusia_phi.AAC.1
MRSKKTKKTKKRQKRPRDAAVSSPGGPVLRAAALRAPWQGGGCEEGGILLLLRPLSANLAGAA